jgi:hypothetical protein
VFSDRIKTLLLVAIVGDENNLGYLSAIKIIESNEEEDEVSTKRARDDSHAPTRPRAESATRGPSATQFTRLHVRKGSSDLLDSSPKLDSIRNEEKDFKLGI